MIVPMQKTLNGTEYWDKESKETVFYPKGMEPNQ